MKASFLKSLLLVIATLCTTPAWSIWYFLGIQNGVVTDIDTETVRTVGNNRSLWILQNYPMTNVYGAKSMAIQLEIDCKADLIRYTKIIGYTGEIQTGYTKVMANVPGAWDKILYGSLHKSIQHEACLKKLPINKVYTTKWETSKKL